MSSPDRPPSSASRQSLETAGGTAAPPSDAEQEARERLLEAAIEAFATSGYDAASLRSIAEAAGVAYQLIGYHFGSKEDLWRAAVDLAFRREGELGRSLGFDSSGDLREQFRNHLRYLLVGRTQNPQWRKIVTHEYLTQSPRYRDVIKPRLEEFVRLLSGPYVDELVRLGIVTRFTAQETHLIINGLFHMARTDEFTVVSGEPAGTLHSLHWVADLIFSVCTRGTGTQPLRGVTTAALEAAAATVPQQPPAEAASTGHRWGDPHGGMPASDLARLRQLETENQHLKELIGELSLEKRLREQALKPR